MRRDTTTVIEVELITRYVCNETDRFINGDLEVKYIILGVSYVSKRVHRKLKMLTHGIYRIKTKYSLLSIAAINHIPSYLTKSLVPNCICSWSMVDDDPIVSGFNASHIYRLELTMSGRCHDDNLFLLVLNVTKMYQQPILISLEQEPSLSEIIFTQHFNDVNDLNFYFLCQTNHIMVIC